MKIEKLIITSLTIILVILIPGCQSTPPIVENQLTNPAPANSEVQNIQVSKVDPQKIPGSTEEFPLPNCGGTGKLTQSLGTQVSVSKSVQMGTTVSVSGGGEVGVSAAAKISIEAAIEAAYNQEYQTANSRLDTIGMEAAPKTHVVYTIEWEKQEFSSIVTFEFNREVVQTPYTFTMNVPKIAGSREEQCPDPGSGIVVIETSTNASQYSVILFSDDFSTNKNSWRTGKYESNNMEHDRTITNGMLEFNAFFKLNAFSWTNVPGLRVKDFYMTVDAEIYQSSTNSTIGVAIAFRHVLHRDVAYVVMFSEDSSFYLMENDNENFEVIHYDQSDAFNLSDGNINHFAVRAEGQRFTVYANGIELYSFNNDFIKSVGEIGLGVNGDIGNSAIVKFDNIIIYEVP